jgi:hypothetical protein
MADENDDASGGGDADKAVAAMAAKNAELLKEKKALAEKLRAFEAEKADREKALADAEEEKARKSKDFETIEKGYQTKLQKAEAEAFTFKAKYESLIIDRGLDDALDAAKVNPALKKAALALIKAEHGVELSEDGKASIEGKPLADFIAGWAKSDTGKAFISNGSSGGGAGGGGNGGGGDMPNPWKKGEHFNLTKQGQLVLTNPELAKRMKAEAGVR